MGSTLVLKYFFLLYGEKRLWLGEGKVMFLGGSKRRLVSHIVGPSQQLHRE